MNKKTILFGLCIILILVCITTNTVAATWCDNNYGKKAPILINNTGGSAQTYYQVMLNYTYDSDMNSNFSDTRVYNESDCSLVPLWNESAVDSSWNKIWFNATNIPTSSWTNDSYYLYYDNSSANSASNISNTFIFGDDFDDGVQSWTIKDGSASESSSEVYVSGSGCRIEKDLGSSSAITGIAFRIKGREKTVDDGFGFVIADIADVLADSGRKAIWTNYETYNNNKFEMAKHSSGQYYITMVSINIIADTDMHILELQKHSGDNYHALLDGIDKGNSDYTEETNYRYITLGYDDDFYVDYFLIRKYNSSEPTAQLGTEESQPTCTTPEISDLTNSIAGITNVTITWSTNQSADNRVKYSKNSDLSSEEWSSWCNDTSSISIDISNLDSDTQYYYQANSYNGTDSNCLTTEPISSPYKNFTTQSVSPKKASIHINNTAGDTLSYYQINLNITYVSNMKSDFSDIRIKNETAGTFVPYWIEDKSDGVWCNLWFNAPSIPASSWCNNTYYLYYGDTDASSMSDGNATFEFFDSTFESVWSNGIERYSGNPILRINESNYWEDDCVRSASVLYDSEDEIWKMWYMSGNGSAAWYIPTISYATSTDGINWTKYEGNPVFNYITDEEYPRSPSVMKINSSMYYMYYSARDSWDWDAYTWERIFLATSPDGTNWTRSPNNPIISNETANPNGLTYGNKNKGEPAVVYFNNTWHMLHPISPVSLVGWEQMLSTSSEHDANWSHIKHTIKKEDVDCGDEAGNCPCFIHTFNGTRPQLINGKYWQIHSCWSTKMILDIKSSTDLKNWTNEGTILTQNGSGWDGNEAHFAEAILHEDDTLYLYYTGQSVAADGHWQIGLARVYNFSSWVIGGSGKWITIAGSPTVSNETVILERINSVEDDIRTEISFSDGVAFRSKLKVNGQSSNYYQQWGFSDATTNMNWHLSLNGTFFYKSPVQGLHLYSINNSSGSTTRTTVSLPDEEYHVYDITWLSNENKFYKNGTLLATHTTNTPNNSCFIGAKAYAEDSSKIIIDWILVRKYNLSEPSAQLGTEESQPLSTTPSISGEYPASPVQNDTSESTVIFGATINQTSNNQWIGDFGAGNTTLEWDYSTSSPAYTNTTFNQTTGDNSYTIYLKAFNSSNSLFNSSTSWVWNITDVTPPASVTGLTNSTYAITYINWTWTNPTDADFNHTMVFINESFEINVTTPFYNDTGLIASTQYNISTRTVDVSGNINQTWVNVTSTTASPTFIPPDPTNLANTAGNFWCNFTWDPGAGSITNSYNVTMNGTGYNGSSNTFYNNSVPSHGWSNITVSAWNSSGSGTLSSGSISDNIQIPNNEPSLSGLPDNSTNEDVNQSDIFDLDDYFTDADGDNPTFDVESNNQSANVSVSIDGENRVDYTLTLNWYGVASVVINVSDGWGGYDNDTFLIIVSSVNDAPITSNLQTEGQTDPTDITDYTPDFTWTYSDPVEGDVQSHWQIYVGTSSGLSDKWDSGELVGADTADVYAGSVLVNGTTYYVQVRTKDGTDWSSWATGTFEILLTTFNITIFKGYNLIGYIGTVNSSAEVVVGDIDYTNYITILEKSTTDYFRTHTKGFSINNFTTEHGYGYYLFATIESIYERNDIASFSFNTTLKEGWNIIGRTNSTGINAEQLSNSVGINCSYVADLNPNGEIIIHTKGFNGNNFNIVKGRAYFVHVNKDMRWERDA